MLIGLQIIGRFLNFKHKLIVRREKLIACLMWNNLEVMPFDTGLDAVRLDVAGLSGWMAAMIVSMCIHEDDPSR